MKVFLMRHAQAGYGPPDPERTLTTRGQETAEAWASYIQDKGFFSFAEIWSSPYRRARQTANPMERILNQPATLVEDLIPSGSVENILGKIQMQQESVLLVGHNPHMSMLASRLLGGSTTSLPTSFRKAAIMAFNRDEQSSSSFKLVAYLTPASLGF